MNERLEFETYTLTEAANHLRVLVGEHLNHIVHLRLKDKAV